MGRRLKPVQVAEEFGRALDSDDFKKLKKLIDEECVYTVGNDQLIGPDSIADSYRKNMIEGRHMLDELVWGESGVEEIEPNEFIIHFTDHIKHQGQSFIHRSQQRITINEDVKVDKISHVDDPDESARLQAFFEQVGLD